MPQHEYKLSFDTTPLDNIPQLRLIGSKYRVLSRIFKVMRDEKVFGDSFFDVFSGSSCVGRYFKRMFSVSSNDCLYFSYVLQRGLVVLNECPRFEGLKAAGSSPDPKKRVLRVLDFLNRLDGTEGFVFRHYTSASRRLDGVERFFFSEENGKKIDSVRMIIERWLGRDLITEDEYFYLITALLLAVQKVSNTSGTYGAFNKFWDVRAKRPLTLKFIGVVSSKFEHEAFNADSLELAKDVKCDIAYLDPPYNSRQYITNYHFLESLSRYDDPLISGKAGIRSYGKKEKSDFCSKAKVYGSLSKLLNDLNSEFVVMSYSSEGLLSKDEIFEVFEESKFKKVKLHEFPYRRFKSNRASGDRRVREYVFIGR